MGKAASGVALNQHAARIPVRKRLGMTESNRPNNARSRSRKYSVFSYNPQSRARI